MDEDRKRYYLKRLQPHDGKYELIPFLKNEFTIGRALDSNFNIPSTIISRCHAIFKKKNNSWMVKNCSSSGVFINDTSLPKNYQCEIKLGNTIQFGQPKQFNYEFRMKEISQTNRHHHTRDIEEELSLQKKALEQRLQESESLTDSLVREKNSIQISLEEENRQLHLQFQERQNALEQQHQDGILAQQNILQEKETLAKELQSKISEMEARFEFERSALEEKLQQEEENKTSILKGKENVMAQLQAEKEALERRLEEEREKDRQLEEEKKTLEEKLKEEAEQRLKLQVELEAKESTLKLKELQHMKLEEHQATEAKKLSDEKLRLESHLKEIEGELEKKNMLNFILEGELEVKQEADMQLQAVISEKESLLKKLEEACEKDEKVYHLENALSDLEKQKQSLEEKIHNAPLGSEEGKKEIIDSISNVVENEFQCSVCNELFITAMMLNCSHTFCKFCIDSWKKNKKDCPICRTQIRSETRSLVVDNFIEKIVGTLSDEMKQRRQDLTKEREAAIKNAEAIAAAAAEAARVAREERNARGNRRGRGRGRGANSRRGQPNIPPNYGAPGPSGFGAGGGAIYNNNSNNRGRYNTRRGRVASPLPPPLQNEDQGARGPQLEPVGASSEVPPAIISIDSDESSISSTDGNESDLGSDMSTSSYESGPSYAYYGGYGRCYTCGRRGHWANGCPDRW